MWRESPVHTFARCRGAHDPGVVKWVHRLRHGVYSVGEGWSLYVRLTSGAGSGETSLPIKSEVLRRLTKGPTGT